MPSIEAIHLASFAYLQPVGPVGNRRPNGIRPSLAVREIFAYEGTSLGMATFHARRLPHHYAVGRPLFITWRLHGSLPANRVLPQATTAGQAFLAMDRLFDNARTGPQYLSQPEIAAMVVHALRHRDPSEYQLHNFVVMSNHVHILITPRVAASKVMQGLKRYTAREANRILGTTGKPFWQDESYDRLVRDEKEFARIARYIEMNPVRAGLVTVASEFLWSGAEADCQSAAGYQPAPRA
jgi:putative transposase